MELAIKLEGVKCLTSSMNVYHSLDVSLCSLELKNRGMDLCLGDFCLPAIDFKNVNVASLTVFLLLCVHSCWADVSQVEGFQERLEVSGEGFSSVVSCSSSQDSLVICS